MSTELELRATFIDMIDQDPRFTEEDKACLLMTRDTIVAARSVKDAERLTSGKVVARGNGLFELRVKSRFAFLLQFTAFGVRILRVGFGHAED